MPQQKVPSKNQRQKQKQKTLETKSKTCLQEQPLVNCLGRKAKVTHRQVPAAALPEVVVIAVTAVSQEAPVLDSDSSALRENVRIMFRFADYRLRENLRIMFRFADYRWKL